MSDRNENTQELDLSGLSGSSKPHAESRKVDISSVKPAPKEAPRQTAKSPYASQSRPAAAHTPVQKTERQNSADRESEWESRKTYVKKKKKLKKVWIITGGVALGVILLTGIGFAAYNIISNQGKLGDDPVPTFVGETESDAEDWAAQYKDVTIQTSEDYSEDIDAGLIISQDEEEVDGKTILKLIISKGKDPSKVVALIDFTGKTESEIREWFAENGFTNVKYSYTQDETVPDGTFVSISTDQTEVARDTALEVIISGDGTNSDVPEITLEDFSKMSLQEVRTYAQQNGLTLDVQYQKDDSIPKNQFIRQEPASGSKVKTGDTITVIYSSDTKITIPNVVNKSESEAKSLASSRNLNFSSSYAYSDTVVKGDVISQEPKSGSIVYNSGEIKTVVSMGRPTIGNYIGQSENSLRQAVNALNASGCNIKVNVGRDYSDSIGKDLIMSQSVKDGFVDTNGTITILLSNGPKLQGQNFSGKSVNEFVSWAKQNNVKYNMTERYDDNYAQATIISNNHTSGSIESNDVVDVVCSLGSITHDLVNNMLQSYVGEANGYASASAAIAQANSKGANITTTTVESGEEGESGSLSEVEVSEDGHSVTLHRIK